MAALYWNALFSCGARVFRSAHRISTRVEQALRRVPGGKPLALAGCALFLGLHAHRWTTLNAKKEFERAHLPRSEQWAALLAPLGYKPAAFSEDWGAVTQPALPGSVWISPDHRALRVIPAIGEIPDDFLCEDGRGTPPFAWEALGAGWQGYLSLLSQGRFCPSKAPPDPRPHRKKKLGPQYDSREIRY